MPTNARWHAALTRLCRLAQRESEARAWIKEMLQRNMPGILTAAIEVAQETGPPMPELLAEVLEQETSVEVLEAVAQRVPMSAGSLQEMAIASIRSLLNDPTWPSDEPADRVPVRRHALRIALAGRLAAADRLDEARTIAEEAIVEAGSMPFADDSVRARTIDAYDVIAEAQSSSGDANGAVESARRALLLRRSLRDPLRPPVEGEQRLGSALIAAGARDEACEVLTGAIALLRRWLMRHRDVRLAFEDHAAEAKASNAVGGPPPKGPRWRLRQRIPSPQRAFRVSAIMGWLPNGFDDAVVEHGEQLGWLIAMMHDCLSALVVALQPQEAIREDLLGPALSELAAGRQLVRRSGTLPDLDLRILQLLVRWPEQLSKQSLEISAGDFERVVDEAVSAGNGELAIQAREAEIEFLRRRRPLDHWALREALSNQSQMLMYMRPDEAVTKMQEAVDLAAEQGRVASASALQNLSRRLSASGRPCEGLEAASRAVALMSDEFLTEATVRANQMETYFVTLVERTRECNSDVELSPKVIDAATKMLEDFGDEIGADLYRLGYVATGLFDSAMKKEDLTTAQQICYAVVRLASRRPDDRNIQTARGLLCSLLLWRAVTDGDIQRARNLLNEIAIASREAPDQELLIVEYGKSAADLIGAYQRAGNHVAAAKLARESIDALLSPPYLAARKRDLGGEQIEFIASILELARQPEANVPEIRQGFRQVAEPPSAAPGPVATKTAIEAGRRAAETGDSDAQLLLAFLLAEWLDPPELGEARVWCTKAAEAGHSGAQTYLGYLLSVILDPPELAEARVWYTKAAEAGHSDAQVNLAFLLAEWLDPPQLAEARVWLTKAAEAGHSGAQAYLGGFLLDERLDPPQLAEARVWLTKAAEADDSKAQLALGLLLAEILDPPQLAEARVWLTKAAEAGHADARDALERLGDG
jgi:TPR repeat protein